MTPYLVPKFGQIGTRYRQEDRTNDLLPRMKKAGAPWLSRSLVSGNVRQTFLTPARMRLPDLRFTEGCTLSSLMLPADPELLLRDCIGLT